MNFNKLGRYVDSLPAAGVPGCDLAVFRDHELLFRRQAGYRDEAQKQPMRGDEAYCLYSCTKVITTCAAMQLIGAGKMGLDDPVSDYLPAYAHLRVKDGANIRPAKTVMTVRHLMSMQSGLNYDLGTASVRQATEAAGGNPTTRQVADAKALDPLEFDPGTDFLYSLSHDVLAAVIEVVSGQRFFDYLREHIFAPLGMSTAAFALSDETAARLCAQYVYNSQEQKLERCAPDANHLRIGSAYESGGAGLICDVKDYITFADALACDGRSADGTQILAPEMIQLWSANQLGAKSRASFDGWNRLGYSYGLGVRTRVDLNKGGRGSIGEFGWDGAAGAFAVIDPHRHISAFYAMHVRNFAYAYDVIHPTLRDLIYEAME
ncbi:MAG: beta-lactamase family protein [Clostridia bacterium]|nr:beta-lactamase family protein [Clostridia bacterium]